MVGKWTSDIFMFESQDIENSGNDDKDAEIAISEEMQYATMEAALSAYGITEKVVPVIPDEFDIVAIDVIPLDGENTLFYASYRNFDKYLTLQITVHNVPEARSFEKILWIFLNTLIMEQLIISTKTTILTVRPGFGVA